MSLGIPDLPPAVPRRKSALLQRLGRLGLRLFRWRIEGNVPDMARMVIIVAPHTSNWDFFVGMFADLALDMDAKWFGKHSIFRWPIGGLLRALGGIPIVRHEKHHVVDSLVAEFTNRSGLVLALAPEGTRLSRGEWRTGFWHIAKQATVPIVPVALDYRRRAVVIGAPLAASDDIESDLLILKGFYAGVTPKRAA